MLNFVIFRFLGDFFLISSRVVVLLKIRNTKSVHGLSLKTALCYLVTYVLRYSDLRYLQVNSPLRIYNFVVKIVFLVYQVFLIYYISVKYRKTYTKKKDDFPFSILFVISFFMGLIVNYRVTNYYLEELLYSISLILESVSILPQLVLIQEIGECEVMTSNYIILLGLYRFSYFLFFFK